MGTVVYALMRKVGKPVGEFLDGKSQVGWHTDHTCRVSTWKYISVLYLEKFRRGVGESELI
jgi:hypothetical protein